MDSARIGRIRRKEHGVGVIAFPVNQIPPRPPSWTNVQGERGAANQMLHRHVRGPAPPSSRTMLLLVSPPAFLTFRSLKPVPRLPLRHQDMQSAPQPLLACGAHASRHRRAPGPFTSSHTRCKDGSPQPSSAGLRSARLARPLHSSQACANPHPGNCGTTCPSGFVSCSEPPALLQAAPASSAVRPLSPVPGRCCRGLPDLPRS